jgi:hypothetical protein
MPLILALELSHLVPNASITYFAERRGMYLRRVLALLGIREALNPRRRPQCLYCFRPSGSPIEAFFPSAVGALQSDMPSPIEALPSVSALSERLY